MRAGPQLNPRAGCSMGRLEWPARLESDWPALPRLPEAQPALRMRRRRSRRRRRRRVMTGRRECDSPPGWHASTMPVRLRGACVRPAPAGSSAPGGCSPSPATRPRSTRASRDDEELDKRSGLQMEDLAGQRFNPLCDTPPMHRLALERLQDEHVERVIVTSAVAVIQRKVS